jgi:hypothetical protein
VLVRLSTGRDPFAGTDAAGERDALSRAQPLRIGDIPATLPEGMRRLLARAVHPDPAQRIRRAEELSGDLRVLRASWDSIAIRPEKPLPFPSLARAATIGILAVLLLAAVFLARGCRGCEGFPG